MYQSVLDQVPRDGRRDKSRHILAHSTLDQDNMIELDPSIKKIVIDPHLSRIGTV